MRKLLTFLLFLLVPVLNAASRLEDYGLILEDPPVAARIQSRTDLHSAVARNHLQVIQAAQAGLKSELARRHIAVVGSVLTLLNAVFVRVPADRAAELEGLPGVTGVYRLPVFHRDLDQAVQLVGVPAAWSALGGVGSAGAGVKIGVLDSGIEQTHPAFQDPSLSMPSGFPKGDSNYTNNKVIVARSYVATLARGDGTAQQSRPDDISPRDRSGHGTAVAMIAAGAQNTGPLATITGVAPKAWLGNYKVFGTPGVNDDATSVIAMALDDAFNDGMDIVVIAGGGPPGYGFRQSDCPGVCDSFVFPMEQAVANAVSRGMTVVLPAGNDGNSGSQVPTLGTIQTPGIAPTAITVGSSTNTHVFFSSLQVSGSGVPSRLQNIDAVFGDVARPSSPVSAPLRDVAQLGNDGFACAPLPGGSLAGAFALIQRGNCAFNLKINNAGNAGAVGAVVYQNDAGNAPFTMSGLIDAGIPAVMIGNADGVSLKGFLQSNPNSQTTMDPTLHAQSSAPNTAVGSSSRGPVIGDLSIKPDLVAVGGDIYTATEKSDANGDLYDSTGYREVGGTSFAASLVAGAAALVKQKNSGLTPGQVKSALVNTATQDVTDASGTARVDAVGAGKLNAAAAVAAGVTAEPATLSFGAVTSPPSSLALRITNTGAAAGTFNLAVAPRDQDSNARITLSQSSVSLNPGQQTTVSVQLTGTRPAPGSYEGFVTISGGNTNLNVPYLYLAGSGTPASLIPIRGESFSSVINDPISWLIGFRLLDQYGVPVANQQVRFQVQSGGGSIQQADATTDKLGIAAADVLLGPQVGEQVFTGSAGGLTAQFIGYARPSIPAINAGGVVNAASGQVGQGLAPGSYISIFGSGLSDATKALNTTSLPIQMAGVSVSFDGGNLSLPGRLSYVSDGQVNVQIPWEFQGMNSVKLKVTIGVLSSDIYTVPLADYAPAAFEYDDAASGRRLAAVLDQNNAVVSGANAARRGQTIQIFANGLGPVNNGPASGEPSPSPALATTKATPSVTIGGSQAQVSFSGLAPFFVGLYQVNVVVPADAPTGLQPLVITVNGVASKSSMLPVQ